MKIKLGLIALLAVLCTACVTPPDLQAALPTDSHLDSHLESQADHLAPLPEGGSAYVEKFGTFSKKFMISAANPLATEAGYQILKSGGTAVDAAIATQMVLTLVEPQSSGIGGGAFLLHFDGDVVKAFDGRETAPASANEKLFQRTDGTPMPFYEGVVGGRSTGVPGVLRMLELAHKQYGRLPWATLFAPAITLAEEGFPVSARLNALLQTDKYLKSDALAAAYFYDKKGVARPIGYILKNPALARTLRVIAAGGADAFYGGDIARDIAKKVTSHTTNPGELTVLDIASYQAKVREPICSDYKRWSVCGMPPPSSGGIAVAQILGLLEQRSMEHFSPRNGMLSAQGVHLFSEAGRLAYADRSRYVADPDFVPITFQSLIDKTYLADRAALITNRSMGVAKFGVPVTMNVALGADTSLEFAGTSHMSIVDGSGSAVSMTSSIEDAFGSRQMVDGFLLNNQLTDFSFDAVDENGVIANRVQAGKRPRSAMAPTFVLDKASHQLILSIGSPGGSAIINYVTKVLIGLMDWDLNVQQAISLPNFGSRNGPTELEQGRIPDTLLEQLKAKGHTVRLTELTSGLQGIMLMNVHGEAMWFGGSDPRREGTAKGD